jgi:cell division transport system permease protein
MPMSEARNSSAKPFWRQRGNISVVMSMSLVLLMMGIVWTLVALAAQTRKSLQEAIGVVAVLKEGTSPVQALSLKSKLNRLSGVAGVQYVPADVAARQLQEELGEDFITFIGYNPLLSTLEIRMTGESASADGLKKIAESLKAFPEIKETRIQEDVAVALDSALKKIGLGVLAFAGLLGVLCVTLIHQSIRISIFSQRFGIKTMQLVGATTAYIRQPFLRTAMVQGFMSALCAGLMMTGILAALNSPLPEIGSLLNFSFLMQAFGMMLALGICISIASTWFAVGTYLRKESVFLYQ